MGIVWLVMGYSPERKRLDSFGKTDFSFFVTCEAAIALICEARNVTVAAEEHHLSLILHMLITIRKEMSAPLNFAGLHDSRAIALGHWRSQRGPEGPNPLQRLR